MRGREKQAYTFQYDFLNRMTEANYAEINTAEARTNDQNKYMEKLTYDLRGNINTLKRNGLNATSCTVGMIDDLTYYYNDNNTAGFSPGNRLKRVVDASDKTKGFKTPITNTNNADPTYLYSYDANGNLTIDKNKGIISIQYNHLNLPTLITFTSNRTIAFLYDGGGTKLKKTVVNNGVTELIQDYVGGIEYKTTPSVPIVLEAIYHSEGRITTINGSLKYEYALRDHLGNTRLMFSDKNNDGVITQSLLPENSEVSQENHYYSFGMAMEGVWANTPSVLDSKYTYNGKELNSDFGLEWMDYGARFYDAALGRWHSIDILSEKYMSWTPYNYVMDNPIRLNDPDGMAPEDIVIRGANNSSVTLKTDILDVTVDASSLGFDFGGNYNLDGEGFITTGLDIVGLFDPTGAADIISAGRSAKSGDWWGAGASVLGAVIPFGGDLAKIPKIKKGIEAIETAIEVIAKNSKLSQEVNHGYEIFHKVTEEVTEYGISAQKLTHKGTKSPRIKAKLKQKYNKDPNYDGRILEKNIPGRQNGLNWEQGKVDNFFEQFGRAPSRQERPTPKPKPPTPPTA